MKRALAVVAHPDDETIWMGGMILQNKNFDWTIFSLCRGNDRDRAPKFKRVCAHYKARPIITDVEDEDIMTIKESVPVILKTIRKFLPRKNFDCIFTHNANGEYGHPRHKGVHKAMLRLIKDKYIAGKNIFMFAYQPTPSAKTLAIASKNAAIKHKMPIKVFREKQYIMKNIYGFKTSTPDFQSAGREEAFNFPKI